MKTFLIIFAAGIFTGVNFMLSPEQFPISTILFYLSIFIMAGYLLFDYRNRSKLKRRIILQSKFKPLGTIGAGLCTVVGLIYLVTTLFDSPAIVDLVCPIASILSGFCILLATVTYQKDMAITKNLVMLTIVPIYWLVLEIVFIFKEHLVNPIIADYIMMLFPAMATTLAYYYFVGFFCSTRPRNFFTPSLMFSIFLNIALILTTAIMFITKLQPVDLILHHLRIFFACLSVQVFLMQYYSRTVVNDEDVIQ